MYPKDVSINIVGFTGTRVGCTDAQHVRLEEVLKFLWKDKPRSQFHEGDCIGSDLEASSIAFTLGYWVAVHPPEDDKLACGRFGNVRYPVKHYLARNRDIVDACSVLIACPGELTEQQRSGTWSTVRYARSQKKPVIKIMSTGEVFLENMRKRVKV